VQGRGLGSALLLRAADRCLRVASDIGGACLIIGAKTDRAARWYESYGALASTMRRCRLCCLSPSPPTRSGAAPASDRCADGYGQDGKAESNQPICLGLPRRPLTEPLNIRS